MHWAQPDKNCTNSKNDILDLNMQKIISKYFDEFSTMTEASHNAVLEIANREGIEMNKIIVATSFCFDELNHHQAKMNLPSPQGTFIMGGLAGYPFVGDIGKIKRVGQHRHTNTCGALMMVQEHILSSQIHEIDPADYSEFQPEFLALRLLPMAQEIRKAEVPILKTTHLVYDQIENEILKLIINTKNLQAIFPVYILGGIVINTDESLPNYFSQKVFRKVR